MATPLINAPAPVTTTPLVAASNPLRKQTLLGIAPVLARRSEPPAADVAPPAAAAALLAAPPSPAAAPLTIANNPLRKQTLLGIAPVIPERKADAALSAEPATDVSSVSSIVTPAMVATDAPTTTDVPEPPVVAAKPKRAEPVRPTAAALSISHDDLPELKPRRPRWQLPLGVAAALALGVVGLRQLDHAPTPTPAELAHPVSAAKAAKAAKALQAAPQSDEGDDDDDGNDPNAGNDPTPEPTTPDPEPLKAKAQAKPTVTTPSGTTAEPPTAASAGATPEASAATAGGIHVNVDSDPPGARLFWKGKEVGTTPFVLELQPGEKHAYELGLAGYTTRKVVIDGSKTDITIGLRPDSAAPVGLSQRK